MQPVQLQLHTGDGTIAYDDTGGNGPVVLAIPGMGDSRSQYRFLRSELHRAGYRIVTMDVRGQGGSSVDWSDYSARAVAQDAAALLRHLNAGPAIVIGNSFAAGSALWLSHEAPELTHKLVLIAPIVRDLPMNPLTRGILKAGFAGPWRTWFWMKYWDSLFISRTPDDQDAVREELRQMLHQPGRMEALEKMVWLSKQDTEALLKPWPIPVYVVMGAKDPDYKDPEHEMRWISDKLKAQHVLVPGTGHYPHVEEPRKVAEHIFDFLGWTSSLY